MALFGTKKNTGKKNASAAAAKLRRAKVAHLTEGKAEEIIRSPWFTEKALIGTDKGVYVFAISTTATKAHVAAAIKEVYGVAPRKIAIVNLPARRVSKRSRPGHAKTARRRKAYVYLAPGETIQFA